MADAAALRGVNQRIREVEAALRQQRQLAEAELAEARRQTLLVYIWSGYDMDGAASFLSRKRKSGASVEELEAEIAHFFTSATSQELNKMSIEPGPEVAGAARHVVEWRLFLWLRKLLAWCCSGVDSTCPCRSASRFADRGAGEAASPVAGPCQRSAQMAGQVSASWAARLGQLRILALIPVRELQEKAWSCSTAFGSCFAAKVAFRMPARDLILGPLLKASKQGP